MQKVIEQQGDVDLLRSTLLDTQAAKSEVAAQLSAAEAENSRLGKQVETLEEQVKLLADKLDATESERSRMCEILRQLDADIKNRDALKRELLEAKSAGEILRLNFETEEENRKKKVERLEKELESMKQQVLIKRTRFVFSFREAS